MEWTQLISLVLAIISSVATVLILVAIFGVLTRIEKLLVKSNESLAAVVFGEHKILAQGEKLLELIAKVRRDGMT